MTDREVTAESVLMCDICSEPIIGFGAPRGRLNGAMLFWDGEFKQSPVTTLVLAHKDCEIEDLGYSRELALFGDSSAALWHLAGMVLDYDWPAICLRKLALIAWATPLVALPYEVKSAKRMRDGIL